MRKWKGMGTRHEGCRRGEMHEIPDTRREGGGGLIAQAWGEKLTMKQWKTRGVKIKK